MCSSTVSKTAVELLVKESWVAEEEAAFIKLSFDNTRNSLAERIDNIEATLVVAIASSRVRTAVLNSAHLVCQVLD